MCYTESAIPNGPATQTFGVNITGCHACNTSACEDGARPHIGAAPGSSSITCLRFRNRDPHEPVLRHSRSAMPVDTSGLLHAFTPRLPRILARSSSIMACVMPSTSSAFLYDICSVVHPRSDSTFAPWNSGKATHKFTEQVKSELLST